MLQNRQELKWKLQGILIRWIDARLRATNQRGLYGEEVVEEAYKLLTENELTRVFFPKKDPKDDRDRDGAFSKIADDTWAGDCSSREAYMRYKYFSIVRFNDTCFAIGLGHKWPAGYYVGEEYKNDIRILWSSTKIDDQEKLRKAIVNQWCSGFARSPIIGMKDGDLKFGSHFKSLLIADLLSDELKLRDFKVSEEGGTLKEGTAVWKLVPQVAQVNISTIRIMWRRELPRIIAEKIINHLTTNGLH